MKRLFGLGGQAGCWPDRKVQQRTKKEVEASAETNRLVFGKKTQPPQMILSALEINERVSALDRAFLHYS